YLSGAGKLDRRAGGDNAFEIDAGLFVPDRRIIAVAEPDDRIGVDILGLANKLAQDFFPPVFLQRCRVFRMPSGSGVYLADGVKNAAALNSIGGTNTHACGLQKEFVSISLYFPGP